MNKKFIKKYRKDIKREVNKEFPKFLAAKVYPLSLLERWKIALMIIRKG